MFWTVEDTGPYMRCGNCLTNTNLFEMIIKEMRNAAHENAHRTACKIQAILLR